MYVWCIILKHTSILVIWQSCDNGTNVHISHSSVMCEKLPYHVICMYISDILYMYGTDYCVMVCIIIYVKFTCVVSYHFVYSFWMQEIMHEATGRAEDGACESMVSERYISSLISSHFSVQNCYKSLFHL